MTIPTFFASIACPASRGFSISLIGSLWCVAAAAQVLPVLQKEPLRDFGGFDLGSVSMTLNRPSSTPSVRTCLPFNRQIVR
jgi:hypothetical protein